MVFNVKLQLYVYWLSDWYRILTAETALHMDVIERSTNDFTFLSTSSVKHVNIHVTFLCTVSQVLDVRFFLQNTIPRNKQNFFYSE